MAEEFEKQVVETQTGGETPVVPNKIPQNIRKVETPTEQVTAQKTTSVVTPNNTEVKKTQSIETTPQTKIPSSSFVKNESLTKQLYDYAAPILKKNNGIDLDYDRFVNKTLATEESAGRFYNDLIKMSNKVSLPVNIGSYGDFIKKLKDSSPKDVSSFVRAPLQENMDGYTENIQKAAQEKIDATMNKVAKAGLISGDTDVPEKLDKVAKAGLILGDTEIPDQLDNDSQKVMDNLILKNYDFTYEGLSESGIPEVDYEKMGLGKAPKFEFTDKYLDDVTDYDRKKAFLSQYNEKDKQYYGDNPIANLTYPKDKIQFEWDKDVVKNGSPIDYWNSVPIDAKLVTKKGSLTPLGTPVEATEYIYTDKSTIPMMDVDGAQELSIIKKLPAPAKKMLDDYFKTLSNTDKQFAVDLKMMREIKNKKGVWWEEVNKNESDKSDWWNSKWAEGEVFKEGADKLKESEWWKETNKGKIKATPTLLEDYMKSNGKLLSTDQEMKIIRGAFNNQRDVIIGEYLSKVNPTDEDYDKAATALGKIDMMWDLTVSDPANGNISKELAKEDVNYIKYLDQKAKEKEEEKEEAEFRREHPVIGSFRYNVRMPIQYGFEAGVMSLASDIVDLPRKITGYEVVPKEYINMGMQKFDESIPSQLKGGIINEDGGIEFDNLLFQSAKVTTEMIGTMNAARGYSVLLSPVLKGAMLPTKIKNAIPTSAAAFTQYRDDAERQSYNAMIDAGYSKEYAEAVSYEYGINVGVGWALIEPIAGFPLQKSFTKGALKDFNGLLAKGESPWKAMYGSVKSNIGRVGKELTVQTTEEVTGDAMETLNNMAVNRRTGANVLDAKMTMKDVFETGLVTSAVTLFGMGKRGDLYKSPVSQKASVWNAVNNYGNFTNQVDAWVKDGKIDKQQASFMKDGVKEVGEVITGLPSAKELTQSQKVDLGLLIYEKKKLDEEVKSGYVDELFRQQKEEEINKKKQKLDAEILAVYNQNDDRNKVLAERERIIKEKRQAEIEAERNLAEARLRIIKNTEGLESEEKLAEELVTNQRTREQEPTKKKARGGQSAKLAPEQVFDIKDGHHRFIAYSETGAESVPAVDKTTGEQVDVPIGQLNPTQDLASKDREVIDGLKESITKGEPIEPIKVEPIKIEQNAKTVRSTEKRSNEKGQVTKVSQDNGGQNIQQQTQAGTEAGDGKKQVLKKPATKDEANRAHILNPKVNQRTADRAITDLASVTLAGKKKPATPSQVQIMSKEMGLEGLKAKTPTQLYRQAKAQGIPMQEFIDAVDVGMGRKRSKVEPVVKETVVVKPTTEEKVETEKPVEVEKNAYVVDLKGKNKKIQEASEKTEAEKKSEAKTLRDQAKKEKNGEVKKGLETLAEALENPEVTSPADVKVGGKKIGEWLTEQVASGNMTREEMKRINDIHIKNRERYGSAQKAKSEIEANEKQISGIRKVLESAAKLGKGDGLANISVIPGFHTITLPVVRGMAKVMLKGMDMYNNAIAGRDAVKYMKDSKWYKNLSPKEKNAVNKFLKGMDPFEASALIIEEAATAKGVSGEKLVQGVSGKEKRTKKKKVSEAEKKQKRIKAKSKSDTPTVNNKVSMRQFATIDPKDVFDMGGQEALNEYNEIASGLLKSPPIYTNKQVEDYVKSTTDKIAKFHDETFLAKHAEMIEAMKKTIMNEDGKPVLPKDATIDQIRDAFIKYGWEKEFVDGLSSTKMSTTRRGELLGNIMNRKADIKAMISEGQFKGLSELSNKVINNIIKLNPELLNDGDIVRANYILENIVQNKSTDGAGQIEAIAVAQQAEKIINDILNKYGKKSLRTPMKGAQKISLEQVRTLPAVLRFMSGNNKMASELRTALKIQEVSSGHAKSVSDSEKLWDKGMKDLVKKYKRRIINNLENRYRQGIYATLIQNEGGTIEEQNKWLQKNKELLQEDFKQKKRSEDFKDEGELQEKIFNDFFSDITDIEDLHKKMAKEHAGDKSVVDLAMDIYQKNYNKFEEMSRIYGNTEMKKWNNYTHRKWKTVESELGLEQLTDDIASFGMTGERINRQEASSSLDRTAIRPLKNLVLNLDFHKVQDKAIADAYYQSNTLGARHEMRAIMDSDNIRQLLGSRNHSILKKRMIEMVNTQLNRSVIEGKVGQVLNKIVSYILRNRVVVTLGGPTAFIRQSLPVIGSAIFRTGDLEILKNSLPFNKVDDNLFSKSNISVRILATKYSGLERGVPKEKAAANKIGRFLNEIDYVTGNISENYIMKPLTYGDALAAKVSWMAYYKQFKKDQGKIDWKKEAENPDINASAYADQMVEASQNVNDISMAGNFFKSQQSGVKLLRSILMPYSSFMVNQDARIMDAARGLVSGKKQDTIESAGDIASVISEQVLFQMARTASQYMVAGMTAYAFTAMLGASDDEQDEIFKQRLEKILPENYFTKLTAEVAADLAPMSMLVGPVLMNLIEGELKRVANDYLSETLNLKDSKGKPQNLVTVKYTKEYEDPNFKGFFTEEGTQYLGMLGDALNDIDDVIMESIVAWNGKYKSKSGKEVQLNDYQKQTLGLSIVFKLFGTLGLGSQETMTSINVNRNFIKDQLKKSAKSGRGGRGPSSGSGTSVYGESVYPKSIY